MAVHSSGYHAEKRMANLKEKLIMCITLSPEAGTAFATFALALATFILVIVTLLTMKESRRQFGTQAKIRELQKQEEVYSKFMGIKVSTGFLYLYQSRMNALESFAKYSEEAIDKVHDAWLLAVLQGNFEADKEFFKSTKDLWEVLGLVHTRFECTAELTTLINNVEKVQQDYLDKFIYNAVPPEGLTLKQVEDWVRQTEKDLVDFDETKLDPALGGILKYLRDEINEGRNELEQMETDTKHWWKIW